MRPLCRIAQFPPPICKQLPCPLCCVMVLKNPENLPGDFVHRQVAIHRNQPARALVVIRHRRSLLLIRRADAAESLPTDRHCGLPAWTRQHRKFRDTGRLEMDVIDPSTGGTRTASSDPEQQLIIVHLEADHNWPGPSRARVVKELVIEQSIQPAGLRCRTRKPVQNITALAIRQLQPLPNHVANQVVGNQLATGHHRLGDSSPVRFRCCYVLPQQISGGDLRESGSAP
jgi:hypothetical protein